tara:strand:- start:3837 stop:4013 length:177 start_codon:yes stop_codon:yes gene_type:complete
MYEVSAKKMSKDEALIYISKLKDNQMVKIVVLSNESAKSEKQLLNETSLNWDFGCYKD